jgi:hypothetical protein
LVTVVYTIVAAQNSTGFHSIGFKSGSPLIPFAVTADWQKVGASDLPGFFSSSGCVDQAPFTSVRITGLAAINTTLIEVQRV